MSDFLHVFQATTLSLSFSSHDCNKTGCFKLFFSFFHPGGIPRKLPSGLWNCSASYYSSIHHHLDCNLKTECEDGQDETEHCPFSSPECQGLVALCNHCYQFVTYLKSRFATEFTSVPLNSNDSCPDSHYRCPGDFNDCLPVYTRCNGMYDCLDHQDEEGCEDLRCPGFFRCRESTICVHNDNLCDGWSHCPLHDDELLCDVACPVDCVCQGHTFLCFQPFTATLFPQIRYLDATGSGQTLIYWSIQKSTMKTNTTKVSRDISIARRLITVAVTDFMCWFPIGTCGLLAQADCDDKWGLPAYTAQQGMVYGVCDDSTSFCKMHLMVPQGMYARVGVQRLSLWCDASDWGTQVASVKVTPSCVVTLSLLKPFLCCATWMPQVPECH
ncbi:hypothetical protein ACOMHN_015079 [Nucella lapillus]